MEEERALRKKLHSWDKILDLAVVKTFGRDIRVVNRDRHKPNNIYTSLRRYILSELEFEVDHCSKETDMKQPCIIDVTTKEFCNFGDTENVETVIQTNKNSKIALGMKYRYCIKEGVRFDEFQLGNQIVTVSMTGGSIKCKEDVTNSKVNDNAEKDDAKKGNRYAKAYMNTYNEDLMFKYDHKEKLTIPPQTKVMATITTFSKKFEQKYTLRFRIEKSRYISVQYYTRCQRLCSWFRSCCCCQPSEHLLYAKDLLQDLPNFEMDDRYCWFTLDGTLIWLGEECSVKIENNPI